MYDLCFDLGTGTGAVFRNASPSGGFRVGIDSSREVLGHFDRACGQPVLCPVEHVSRAFRSGCADLVVANPPYFRIGCGRRSPDLHRDRARTGDSLLLYRFIFAGAYLLKPGGVMILTVREEGVEGACTGFRAGGFPDPVVVRSRGVFAVRGLLGDPFDPENRSGEIGGV